jgi:hypothetical protein
LYPVLQMYKMARSLGAGRLLKAMLLPAGYKTQIAGLDIRPDQQTAN